MFNYEPKSNIIDNEIKDILNDLLTSNPNIKFSLEELVLILKHSFKINNSKIKINGKTRNVATYIKFKHKSISSFLNRCTNYKLQKTRDNYLLITN